jgi:hypothetical protein
LYDADNNWTFGEVDQNYLKYFKYGAGENDRDDLLD